MTLKSTYTVNWIKHIQGLSNIFFVNPSSTSVMDGDLISGTGESWSIKLWLFPSKSLLYYKNYMCHLVTKWVTRISDSLCSYISETFCVMLSLVLFEKKQRDVDQNRRSVPKMKNFETDSFFINIWLPDGFTVNQNWIP